MKSIIAMALLSFASFAHSQTCGVDISSITNSADGGLEIKGRVEPEMVPKGQVKHMHFEFHDNDGLITLFSAYLSASKKVIEDKKAPFILGKNELELSKKAIDHFIKVWSGHPEPFNERATEAKAVKELLDNHEKKNISLQDWTSKFGGLLENVKSHKENLVFKNKLALDADLNICTQHFGDDGPAIRYNPLNPEFLCSVDLINLTVDNNKQGSSKCYNVKLPGTSSGGSSGTGQPSSGSGQ